MLFKSSLKVKQTSMDYLDTIISFEAMAVEVEVHFQIVSILIVYRPPPSSANKLSTILFMNEFSALLESYIIKTGSLLIAGDHVDDTSDAVAANCCNVFCWNPLLICDNMFIAIPTELDIPWT